MGRSFKRKAFKSAILVLLLFSTVAARARTVLQHGTPPSPEVFYPNQDYTDKDVYGGQSPATPPPEPVSPETGPDYDIHFIEDYEPELAGSPPTLMPSPSPENSPPRIQNIPPPPANSPPPPPPAPPLPPVLKAKAGQSRRKLLFSVHIPMFSANNLSSTQEKLILTTVQTAALLSGASSPPDVAIVNVEVPSESSRRLFLATGVTTDIEAVFQPGDGNIAAKMANLLQTKPSSIFPQRLFGAVDVPQVKVKRILGAGALAGICIVSIVFAGAVGGMYAVMVSKRRRRGMVGVSYPRPPSKYAWLHNVASKMKNPSKVEKRNPNAILASPIIPPELVITRTVSASSDEDLSLRELYAAKQRMVELEGRPSRGSPPPSLAVSPRPSVAPLSSSNPRGSLVVFENPLASVTESADGESAVEGHIEVSNISSSSECPPPAVLAGWFKEARKKSLEKKAASNLNRRQSFRSG